MTKVQEILCSFSYSSHCCFSQLCLGSKLKITMSAVCILVTEKLIRGFFFTSSGISILLVLNGYMLKGFIELPFLTIWYILPYNILPSFIRKSKEIAVPMD